MKFMNYTKALCVALLCGSFAIAMEAPVKIRKGSVRLRVTVLNNSGNDYTVQGWEVGSRGKKSERKDVPKAEKAVKPISVTAGQSGKFHIAFGRKTDVNVPERQIVTVGSPVLTMTNEVKPQGENAFIYTGILTDGKNSKNVSFVVDKPAETAAELPVTLTIGTSLENCNCSATTLVTDFFHIS